MTNSKATDSGQPNDQNRMRIELDALYRQFLEGQERTAHNHFAHQALAFAMLTTLVVRAGVTVDEIEQTLKVICGAMGPNYQEPDVQVRLASVVNILRDRLTPSPQPAPTRRARRGTHLRAV